MNPEHLSFPVRKTASVYYYGKLQAKKHIYVLHGYKQLARFFMRHFQNLLNEDTCVIAPEGLHRFYTEGNHGRVGASWMTKEQRHSDIEDYIGYLNDLSAEISMYKDVILIGFSQGVATAFRWMMASNISFSKVLMCSGMVPEDVSIQLKKGQGKSKFYYLSGNEDPFKDDAMVENHLKALRENGLEFEEVIFEGGHTIDPTSVLKILSS